MQKPGPADHGGERGHEATRPCVCGAGRARTRLARPHRPAERRPWPPRSPGRSAAGYPLQFWLLFSSTLIFRAGSSLLFPFLTLFLHERLGFTVATAALALGISSAAGMAGASLAGPMVDRFGRKRCTVLALIAGSAVLAAMGVARSFPSWCLLMVVEGIVMPLVRVGSNAMVADLVAPARRAGAYALLRVAMNVARAAGTAAGGFVIAVSYRLAFSAAAIARLGAALLLLLCAAETMRPEWASPVKARAGGYARVLRDRAFLAFCALSALTGMTYSLMETVLPIHAREGLGLREAELGLIMSTSAAMVVLFQYIVTRVTERRPHLQVLAVGALFHAVGVGSVAWGRSCGAVMASMAVLTVGDMISVPTAVAAAASPAPPGMRGRYMSVYSLNWETAYVVGPLVAGLVHDGVGPQSVWHCGLAMGLAAAAGFVWLARQPRAGESVAGPAGAAEGGMHQGPGVNGEA